MKYKTLTNEDALQTGDEFFDNETWHAIVTPTPRFRLTGAPYRRPIPEGWIPVSEAGKYVGLVETVVFTSTPMSVLMAAHQASTGYFVVGWTPDSRNRCATHFQVLSSEVHEVADSDEADFQHFYKSDSTAHLEIHQGALRRAFMAGRGKK